MTESVLDEALDTLTVICNRQSFDPHRDKATAFDAFTRLKEGGHSFDKTAIRQGARARGWSTGAENALAEIGSAVLEGRRLRSRGRSLLRTDALAVWTAEAERHQREAHS